MDFGGVSIALADLPRRHGESAVSGTYRHTAADFVVEEELGYAPSGEGAHHWLWVEKVGISTDEAAAQLARGLSVSRKDIGYAGKKDTHAVARQWFSVPEAACAEIGPLSDAVTVLSKSANPRKLKVGQLAGNRFSLRVVLTAHEGFETRLEAIAREGVPNYFGDQRFGRSGHNLAAARRLAARDPEGHRRLHPKDGMAASAARSALFNRTVAARVASGTWLDVKPGDSLMLAGRGSIFQVDADQLQALTERVRTGELNPTASLWGLARVSGPAQAREEAAVAALDPMLSGWLAGIFPREERRAARVIPDDMTWSRDGAVLSLSFRLPRGSYATTVLHELGEIVEAHARASA